MIHQATSIQAHSTTQRTIAIFDVLLVFLATFTLIWLLALLPIGKVERNYLSYVVMMGFPLLILLYTRRDLKSYGLASHRIREQLNMTMAIFPIVAIQGAVTGWLLPELIPHASIRWEGALLNIVIWIPFFFWVASILRRKPTITLLLPAFLYVFPQVKGSVILPDRLVSFVFYLMFLGPSEEFLFRGYIQSRLNVAFGRPFQFWGVSFGWGLAISSLLFGLMHLLNPFNPFIGKFDVYICWGVWTVFGGLSMGYIREKTGSILPSAILHGLPQAIACICLGFFAGA